MLFAGTYFPPFPWRPVDTAHVFSSTRIEMRVYQFGVAACVKGLVARAHNITMLLWSNPDRERARATENLQNTLREPEMRTKRGGLTLLSKLTSLCLSSALLGSLERKSE